MSTSVMEIIPVIPARRSRSPDIISMHTRLRDIIDVDLMDDEEIAQSQRYFQRRRLNPDDDIVEVTNPNQGSSSSSRYRSPPPPQRHGSVPPPIPAVPRNIRRFGGFAFRRAQPSSPPGIVRPNTQPFAFEANFGHAQRASSPPQLPPTAAPPSHHTPAMSVGRLGGALIAHTARRSGPAPGRANAPLAGSRIRNISSLTEATDYVANNIRFLLDRVRGQPQFDDEMDDFAFNDMDFYSNFRVAFDPQFQDYGPAAAARAKKMEFKAAFTHPGKMPADFTPDFGPSEQPPQPPQPATEDVNSAGPSSVSSSNSSSAALDTILVCAQCLDPLVIGGGPESSAAERRLWALRCGHILDGKCVEKLMKPEELVEQLQPTSEPMAEEETTGTTQKRNMGKGKAKEVDPQEEPASTRTVALTRSLRSGRTVQTREETTAEAIVRKPRQRKGKSKMQMPAIEKVHDWRCPVSGCGKVHQSVLITGAWKMDEKIGAITMYV